MGMHDHQTYEVQVHHNGRWQVHARYDYHERAVALREAKELDREKGVVAVRVILEDYQPDTGRHVESLIYRNKVDPQISKVARTKSANSWADMAVSSDGRVGYQRSDVDMFLAESADEAEDKPKARVGFMMLGGIILNILAVGLGAGGAAAGLLYLMMKGFRLALQEGTRDFILIAMFSFVALIAASASYGYYRDRFNLNPFVRKKKEKPVVKKSKVHKEMDKAAREIDKMAPPEGLQDQPPEEDFHFITPDEAIDADEEFSLSDVAEEQKTFLITFMGTALGAMKTGEQGNNTVNRFGMNLFMSAACMAIGERHNLLDEETHSITIRILEMLGTKPDHAEKFCLELEKHLEHPRHRKLFDDAVKVTLNHENGDQAAALQIPGIMQEWNDWKPSVSENENPNLLTIMFTDMVGSTDLTNTHGDYAAQEVLKTHDVIVRTALTNFDGKEIKHLGDGIMASFKRHQDALDAAIFIHKRIEGNNNAAPEFPLHIRLGIHCGEPIRKNNDLFGAAVQLASRLCSFCPADQIIVSKDVVALCGEKPVETFIDLGLHPLKGFNEEHQLFQLDWTVPPIEYEEGFETDEGETVIATPSNTETAPDMEVVAQPKEPIKDDPDFSEGLKVESSDAPPKTASEPQT
jgi:adenylate cyclase